MISIVILSYRNPALLRLCLKSLLTAWEDTGAYEVVVVDNATTPETQSVVHDEFAGAFKNITLIPLAENTGYTLGVNTGLRAARGRYILALNHDIVVTKGAVERMASYMDAHPEVGLLGPELLNFDGSHQDSYFRFYTPFIVLCRRGVLPLGRWAQRVIDRFLMRDTDHSRIVEPDWVSGAAMMVSQTALARVGTLDERFFHYYSDVDWNKRFWENGYKVVYYPAAQLYHYLGRTSKGAFWLADALFRREARWHIMDGFRYFIKHGFFAQKNPRLRMAEAT